MAARRRADVPRPRTWSSPRAAGHAPGSSSPWPDCSSSRRWSARPPQHYRADLASFFGVPRDKLLPYNLVAYLARAAGDLLGVDVFPRRRDLPGPDDHRRSRARNASTCSPTCCSARSCVVVVGSLVGEICGIHGGVRPLVVLARHPRLRVPRSRQVLAGPAHHRACSSGWHPVPRATQALAGEHMGEHAVAVLLRRAGHPGVLCGRACSPSTTATSPSPTSGGSGSCTCGSRTSSSSSPPSWWPTSSCSSAWSGRRSRCASSTSTSILYSAGGVVGTMHHVYFSGEPAEHMALGAFFSARSKSSR